MITLQSNRSTVQLNWQVLVASFVLVALIGAGTGFVVANTDNETSSNTSANVTGLVSENSVASFSQRGPDGYTTFKKQPDGNWTITVNVTEWNDYQILMVYAFKDPYSERHYLHPGDDSITLKDVPAEAFVDLHIPVKQRYGFGYVWEKEYWLDNSVRGNQTHQYESDVLITAVDQNYSTKAEEEDG